jgi:hypothetical protein
LAAQTAITINSPTAGRIILDLGGFTLSPNPNVGSGNDAIDVANPTGSKIVIQNGTISSFWGGVEVNQPGTSFVSNMHIENMTFYGVRFRSVVFVQVNSSSVTGCSFLSAPGTSAAQYGIQDYNTQTGNAYYDDTFDGIGQTEALAVSFANTVILEHAHFQVP